MEKHLEAYHEVVPDVDISGDRILKQMRIKLEIVYAGFCFFAPFRSVGDFCHGVWAIMVFIHVH